MIDEVIARLAKQHLIIVHGASGCGKSSLVRAACSLGSASITPAATRTIVLAARRDASGIAALSLRNRRRHRGARRRPPAAAPSDAAGIAACGVRAARALPAPRAPPGPRRSWAAARP